MPSPVEVLELIQIYGRLASGACFGVALPSAAAASCQLGSDAPICTATHPWLPLPAESSCPVSPGS